MPVPGSSPEIEPGIQAAPSVIIPRMSALDARVKPVHDGFIPLSNANTKPRPRGRVSPAPNIFAKLFQI